MLRSRENQTPHIETKTKSYCRRKGSQWQARASRSGGRWEQRRSAHGSAGSLSTWPGAAGRVALQGVDGRGDGHLGGWAGLAKARHPKRARRFWQERARWEPARAATRTRVTLSLARGRDSQAQSWRRGRGGDRPGLGVALPELTVQPTGGRENELQRGTGAVTAV